MASDDTDHSRVGPGAGQGRGSLLAMSVTVRHRVSMIVQRNADDESSGISKPFGPKDLQFCRRKETTA